MIHRLSFLLAPLAVAATFSTAAQADVGCPMAVEASQTLAAPQDGWTADVDDLPTELAGISVFDGPPEQLAELVPDDGGEIADSRSEIWNLHTNDRGYWLICRYASTIVTLTRQLPPTVTRCEAVYEKQLSFVGGAPVVRSAVCGPAAP